YLEETLSDKLTALSPSEYVCTSFSHSVRKSLDHRSGGKLVLFGQNLKCRSAIQCINCIDYTGSCTSTKHCNLEDACLTLKERGGDTYRQCIKYSDCNQDQLTQMFPSISKFNFQCCTSNLCNGATSIGPGKHLLGLFASLAVMWWCMH
uniref:MAC-inhibitory protein n=1 Tax=Esox lucius TaxID=8010 RepID=A0AAY5L2I0_ESOLU